MAAESRRLVTIGYERRAVDELAHELASEGVEIVVDVRQRAMSRKRGFGKTGLAAALMAVGIDYVHEPTLGNPKENRGPFHTGDPAARDLYELQMRSVGGDALRRVGDLAATRAVALLCYERDAAICHRSVIAAALREITPSVVIVDV